VKIPVSDTFEQLASISSTRPAQFHRIASFILATPRPNEDSMGLVSLTPTIDQFIDENPIEKKHRRVREKN